MLGSKRALYSGSLVVRQLDRSHPFSRSSTLFARRFLRARAMVSAYGVGCFLRTFQCRNYPSGQYPQEQKKRPCPTEGNREESTKAALPPTLDRSSRKESALLVFLLLNLGEKRSSSSSSILMNILIILGSASRRLLDGPTSR